MKRSTTMLKSAVLERSIGGTAPGGGRSSGSVSEHTSTGSNLFDVARQQARQASGAEIRRDQARSSSSGRDQVGGAESEGAREAEAEESAKRAARSSVQATSREALFVMRHKVIFAHRTLQATACQHPSLHILRSRPNKRSMTRT